MHLFVNVQDVFSLLVCIFCFCFFFLEFFVENMGDFFIFLRRFADDILESSAESLEHILNFITVFMGSVERYVASFFTSDQLHWKSAML